MTATDEKKECPFLEKREDACLFCPWASRCFGGSAKVVKSDDRD